MPGGPGGGNAAPSALGGYQQLVRAEPFRGKFHQSLERPFPFVPGQPDRIGFDLPDVADTFRDGHGIMVQVQSSWFPLIDRNPQTFVTNIFDARDGDFTTQTHRIFRSTDAATYVEVSVANKP